MQIYQDVLGLVPIQVQGQPDNTTPPALTPCMVWRAGSKRRERKLLQSIPNEKFLLPTLQRQQESEPGSTLHPFCLRSSMVHALACPSPDQFDQTADNLWQISDSKFWCVSYLPSPKSLKWFEKKCCLFEVLISLLSLGGACETTFKNSGFKVVFYMWFYEI